MIDVSQHYRNSESSSPNEELNIMFIELGKLGSGIMNGIWNEIDCLETICENASTFNGSETEVE